MSTEHDRKDQAFFTEFQAQILSHIPSDGSEVSITYGKEQLTLCLQKVSRGGEGFYSLILGAYKRKPFRHQMWNEIIGHIDMNITAGDAFLTTTPIPHEVSIDTLVPPLQASEIAFRDRAVGVKIDALEVEKNKRGQGYGVLLYTLGKAMLRERGFREMTIVTTDESEGFYEKFNTVKDVAEYRRHTALTFNAAEQKTLNALRIVGAGK